MSTLFTKSLVTGSIAIATALANPAAAATSISFTGVIKWSYDSVTVDPGPGSTSYYTVGPLDGRSISGSLTYGVGTRPTLFWSSATSTQWETNWDEPTYVDAAFEIPSKSIGPVDVTDHKSQVLVQRNFVDRSGTLWNQFKIEERGSLNTDLGFVTYNKAYSLSLSVFDHAAVGSRIFETAGTDFSYDQPVNWFAPGAVLQGYFTYPVYVVEGEPWWGPWSGHVYQHGYHGYFDVTSLSVTTTPDVPAVPEPETYALFLAGLGVLGFIRRNRPSAH